MRTSLVKSVPAGNFADVSALTRDWQNKMQLLVSQKQPIRYDVYPLQTIPQQIRDSLEHQGYDDLVLEKDQWQHFLVPRAA